MFIGAVVGLLTYLFLWSSAGSFVYRKSNVGFVLAGFFLVAQPGAGGPGGFLAILWVGGLFLRASDEVKLEAVGAYFLDVKTAAAGIGVVDGAERVRCYRPSAGVAFAGFDVGQAAIGVVAFEEAVAV